MLNSTTAVFKRAHHAAIKVQVHCESLDDVLWFLETTHAVHRWNSSSSALSALLFLILMMSSRLKELLQICCRFYCFELLFGGGSGALCSWAQQTRTREGKKALNLGFICRPQTRWTKTKVWVVLLSALLGRNLHSSVQTLQEKNKLTNEIDINCIMWGVTNSHMLDGKVEGCLQWFLSRLT